MKITTILLDKRIVYKAQTSYRLNRSKLESIGMSSEEMLFISLRDENSPLIKLTTSYQLIPICKLCSSNTKFVSWNKGYKNYCSDECCNYSRTKTIQSRTPEQITAVTNKRKQTKLERYGDENFNNTEKREKTNMDKYGDENFINDNKRRETSLSKYGVENYSQASKDVSNGYRWKEYKLPSGKTIKFQGYEDKLLDELLEDYNEDEIITSRKDMPEFWYKDAEGKKRRYFPDVYIPKTNTIYEVKSEYTLNINLEINELKFQSVRDCGYNFNLKIY